MSLTFYYACAIRNADPANQVINDHICKRLEELGYKVLAPYSLNEMKQMTEQQIYERDLDMMLHSNGMIAECSTPSHGVGFEVCYAQFVEPMPLLVLHSRQTTLSAMIRPHPATIIAGYNSFFEVDLFLERYLQQFGRLAMAAARVKHD